jgi:hypothetical protein
MSDILDTACRNPACGKAFEPVRASALYCSTRCRVAAHRGRQTPPPPTFWFDGRRETFSLTTRTINSNGSLALSNAELADRLVTIASDADGGDAKTGRRFYYLALSYGYIQPDMSATDAGRKSRKAAYKRILDILGKLRRIGRLGWDAVLDLTRELTEWQTYASPREARAAMRRNYDEDRWLGQPYYPVLIVEKDTMDPVCRPMAMAWQMRFASSRGYGSLTLQHDVALMLNRRYARLKQPALIYFVSDLDPSGLDLQRSWKEALKRFGVVAIFERVGLTREQVRDNRDALGQSLERLSIEVKDSDSRSKSYIEQYGDRCWEVDILPGEVIEDRLDQDIRGWLDVGMWNRREVEIERARSLL